jgi:hypothetical protein
MLVSDRVFFGKVTRVSKNGSPLECQQQLIHSCGDENQFPNGALKKIENIRWLF